MPTKFSEALCAPQWCLPQKWSDWTRLGMLPNSCVCLRGEVWFKRHQKCRLHQVEHAFRLRLSYLRDQCWRVTTLSTMHDNDPEVSSWPPTDNSQPEEITRCSFWKEKSIGILPNLSTRLLLPTKRMHQVGMNISLVHRKQMSRWETILEAMFS